MVAVGGRAAASGTVLILLWWSNQGRSLSTRKEPTCRRWRRNLVMGVMVWFGLVWNGTGPRHRNGLLSGRFALAPSCAVATYWNMPPLKRRWVVVMYPAG